MPRPLRAAIQPGDRFGRWTVLGPDKLVPTTGWFWRCRCSCGTERPVLSTHLRTGRSQSCGCARREWAATMAAKHTTTHGNAADGRESAEYRIWKNMKTRCTNPHAAKFKDYGGRGIYVCDRWLRSFEAFLADLGPRPSADHTIERKDNDGPYLPDNCRWATRREQNLNKRSTRMVTAFGRTQPLIVWAREYGVRYGTLFARLKRGIASEQALTRPVQVQRRDRRTSSTPTALQVAH